MPSTFKAGRLRNKGRKTSEWLRCARSKDRKFTVELMFCFGKNSCAHNPINLSGVHRHLKIGSMVVRTKDLDSQSGRS